MSERERIQIPDNAAGRLAFDIFRSIAIKMWAVGDEATNDFTISNFPAAETVRKDYFNRQFRRVVAFDSGEHVIITYDYKTQTTSSAFLTPSDKLFYEQ